jgi:Uma2 family endonuclease
MKPLLSTPPRTMMEVYKNLPEGTLAELIDNQLYMSPSPIFTHQKTIQEIFRKLCNEVLDKGRGEVIIAPFDVYLDEVKNAVQPDIIVVLNENRRIIDEKGHIHGIPDILIEILSPNNRDHDLIRKKQLYESFGVKEYWIVDPESKLSTVFEFINKGYKLVAEDIGVIKSKLLETSVVF